MITTRGIAADAARVRDAIVGVSRTRNSLGFKGPSGEGRPSRSRRNERHGGLPTFDEAENVLGIHGNEKLLMEWLTPASAVDEQRPRRVVSVLGMGGLGKTTLVRQVYHHPTVKRSFQTRVWVSFTESDDIKDLMRGMVQELQGAVKGQDSEGAESFSNDALTSKLSELLQQKRYLIVLDDAWDRSVCNQLLGHLPGNNNRSRILVTTRDKNIASLVSENKYVLHVSPLSATDARLLFYRAAFGKGECPRDLEHSAQMIINKCDGLPLAIVSIGRLMAGEPMTDIAWKDMFRCLEWELSNHGMLEDMARGLVLSYKRLPYHLQRCFLYCTMFREGHPIKTKWLIRMWMAEGFIIGDANNSMTMEEIGMRYLVDLVARSMLQVVKKDAAGRPKVCRVHDIMRELALRASNGENSYVRTVDQLINLGEGCRRLSIVRSISGVKARLPLSHVRALLVFTSDPSSAPSLRTICRSLKFLRVLELRGAPIDEVPSNVFKLFNLRYLSLRETNVSKIPRSVKKLYNLQTLDLWKTKVTHLPRRILKLRRLRHLYKEDISAEELTYMNTGEILRGPGAPSGISDLKDLQTLKTIRASRRALVELESMTQLRDLGVTDLHANDGLTLCNSVRKMERLSRLYIKASAKQPLKLDGLSPPPADLHKLILNGRMESMPVWFGSLNSLTHLYLFSSWIKEKESPIPPLQSLPNLVLLSLDDDAYQGRFLRFEAGAFRKLETLLLSNLRGLSELNVQEGALPRLQVMYLRRLDSSKL